MLKGFDSLALRAERFSQLLFEREIENLFFNKKDCCIKLGRISDKEILPV